MSSIFCINHSFPWKRGIISLRWISTSSTIRYDHPDVNYTTACITSKKRFLSSSSSSSTGSGGGVRKGGSTVWQRQAVAVKNTDFENSTYLDAIRAEHDPALHIKTIEDELKGTIGKALGRQGEKILYSVRLMEHEYKKYVELQIVAQEKIKQQTQKQQQRPSYYNHATSDNHTDELVQLFNSMNQCINQYNEHRTKAVQARWELMVHRQAAGFIVDNHNIVMQHYPISDPLPVLKALPNYDGSADTSIGINNNSNKPPPETKKKSRDQLDWWQRIGRWK